jgi:hypothetical protein
MPLMKRRPPLKLIEDAGKWPEVAGIRGLVVGYRRWLPEVGRGSGT